MLAVLTNLLTTYQLPSVFIGAFFFGDSVILSSAYLAGQLAWSPIPIFIAALMGTIASDTLWFLFGKYFAHRFQDVRLLRRERERISGFIGRLVGTRPLVALIVVKFLYGSRVAMILYTASRGMSLSTFSIFNGLGASIWLLVFVPLGYVAGKGMSQAVPLLSAIPMAALVLVLSIIFFRILTLWMEKKLQK